MVAIAVVFPFALLALPVVLHLIERRVALGTDRPDRPTVPGLSRL